MSTGCPTRTRVHPRRHRAIYDARDRGSRSALACGLVVEGIKRGPRCPRCGARGLRRRMRVERAQQFSRSTAASSVPRAVKDASSGKLVSIAHAQGYSPTWAGCTSKEGSATGPHAERCDERQTVIQEARAPRARREEPRALAKIPRGRRRWSARRSVQHALWAARIWSARIVGILALRAGSPRRAGGQRPRQMRRAKQNSGSNWCGAGGFACVVRSVADARDALVGAHGGRR